MSNSFDETVQEEDKVRNVLPIPSLTTDIIYCPKCGKTNSFKESVVGQILNHFCERCGVKLNDYWDAFEKGELFLINCKSCEELTFEMRYCVGCGYKQDAVVRRRYTDISNDSMRGTSQGAITKTVGILTANMRTRNRRATNSLLKKEFYGRDRAWRTFVGSMILSTIIAFVGLFFIYPIGFLKMFENTKAADYYFIIGFALAGLGLILFCCGMPLFVFIIVRQNKIRAFENLI